MVDPSVHGIEWLSKILMDAEPDLIRDLLKRMVEHLMSADADLACNASYRARDDDRITTRNGYRQRRWDSRVGTIDLKVPKLRKGTYFPHWLLEPRRRVERAMVTVIAEAYRAGVSTRRVEHLAEAMGISGLSKSQVSELAGSLDEEVAAFRNRPLQVYPYVWVDGLAVKCREGGRIVNVCVVVATGVNSDGQRETLGLDIITGEDGAGWLAFLKGLTARGLRGTQLVISDSHTGLKGAIAAALPGSSWQRCRTHFMRNLLCKVPKSAQDIVATTVRTIFSQFTVEETHAQHARVVTQLTDRFREAAHLLADAGPEILAFTAFPKQHWRQIWSNNPQERLNKEIRRRTDVVGVFPNRDAAILLIGAVLAEMNDEWAEIRRYMTFEPPSADHKPARTPLPKKEVRKELVVAV
jgi:transposase-like protein